MENERNRIKERLVRSEKDYLKWTSRPSCMSQEIFLNGIAAIHKRKVT